MTTTTTTTNNTHCMNCNAELNPEEVKVGHEICERCDADFNEIDENTMEEAVQALFENIAYETVAPEWGIEGEVRSVRSFREAHLLTHNRGVVVTMASGEEFQIEIQRAK